VSSREVDVTHETSLRSLALPLRSFSVSGLVTSAFAQAHPGTIPILIYERHARILECALDYLESRASRRARSGFQLMNRNDTDTGGASKILLTPR
jgi:hypothetical protein